jgi:hypothetical protein
MGEDHEGQDKAGLCPQLQRVAMKWLVIGILFYIPATVLAINAHTLIDWIQSAIGFALGLFVSTLILYPDRAWVKKVLERF